MTNEEMDARFTYHAPKPEQIPVYNTLREEGRKIAGLIELAVPESREKALAFTHLEQAIMWANAAIARRS